MREVTIGKNDAGQTLQKYLQKNLYRMPASLLQKSIRKGRVRQNGKKVTDPHCMLCVGDLLSLYINDEFFEKTPPKNDYLFAPTDLNILYEDDNILLVDKPAGLAVHDFDGAGSDTLINRILHLLTLRGEYDSACEGAFAPALCNRIDRNTCGIVIAAKNAAALREMNALIRDRRLLKKYHCLCRGLPPKPADEVRLYLEKLENENRCLVRQRPAPGCKTAVTRYKTLWQNGLFSLLEVTLLTGRTHQIRATLSHLGCPILGDGKYGKSAAADRALGFPYQALCSCFLAFSCPDGFFAYLDGKSFSVPDIWFEKTIKTLPARASSKP